MVTDVRTNDAVEIVSANSHIPYALLNREVGSNASDFTQELTDIAGFYSIYKKGAKFSAEGSGGDYVPADLRYKMAAALINKEARFLFGETPDITVDAKGDIAQVSDDTKKSIAALQNYLDTVLSKTMFEDSLLKAAKDCFIGKRVACVANFNEVTGVTLHWLNAMSFYYEVSMGDASKITKFVAFITLQDSSNLKNKRIFMKKYELETVDSVEVCYLTEVLYDGTGQELEQVTEYQATKLKRIPAVVFVNEGLTGEMKGESEIEDLQRYESHYSKLANADIDAERKSMNPIRYTVDMDSASTKGLRISAGAFWDLGSDQNLDKPSPQVGTLESSMEYSSALKTTLDRVKATAFEQVEMPNISLESMTGMITSGKALKTVYWPLIVRCKEKMKVWAPQLRALMEILIEGGMEYPKTIERYSPQALSVVAYEIHVEMNIPLPEDEQEEKASDLEEVAAMTMSKKAYMKKWRQLTDKEADAEIKQMALERQILEDAFATEPTPGGEPNPNEENPTGLFE